MNKKGQALVEFVLIMPIILTIVMILIDIGNLFVQKINLSDNLQTVTELYQNNDTKELMAYVATEELEYNEESINDMVKITLQKNINISAPILNEVLGKHYKIEETKTIYAGENHETKQ